MRALIELSWAVVAFDRESRHDDNNKSIEEQQEGSV